MDNIKLNKPEFLYIEACNFIDYPKGGTLSFALQLLKVFGNKMALVGYTDNKEECGKWTIKNINGVNYYFFGISVKKKTTKKPIIPARITSFFELKKNLKRIASISVNKVFTQTPQFALLLNNSYFTNKCFCFAGTTNSVEISRYRYLRFLSKIYEKKLFKALSTFQVILAAADQEAIQALKVRSNKILQNKEIISFPTRFDDKIFFPQNKIDCRKKLGLDVNKKIFVVSGRLSWVKGWKFLIESFNNFLYKFDENAILIFVGDGEDKKKIESYAKELNINDKIIITGMKAPEEVSLYLNACDIYLCGSYYEGWSTAMTEALGCGCPIVSTNVSGAKDMILENQNGFIVFERDPIIFSSKMYNTLYLKNASNLSYNISKKYTLSSLKSDLENYWLNKSL
jgi:glycosyltransferase involved in cell wall biosynthesis